MSPCEIGGRTVGTHLREPEIAREDPSISVHILSRDLSSFELILPLSGTAKTLAIGYDHGSPELVGGAGSLGQLLPYTVGLFFLQRGSSLNSAVTNYPPW